MTNIYSYYNENLLSRFSNKSTCFFEPTTQNELSLIALSRLYVGVHLPSDVLAGVVTGILSSYVGQFVFEKISEKNKNDK